MPSELSFDPLIGSVLEGQYRVISMLGRGGMGCVYVAEELRLGRRYALKVLSKFLAEDRTNVERFLREARMIAKLSHPNIVDVHSLGEDPSGIVFFTMELLQGEDLESRVRARAERPYTVSEACTWAIQIARAVGAVHDAGLIHRDLKTANVFLARQRDGTEVVKLLDFGIARPEEGSELTGTGVTLGTPSYMSPEQLRSEPLDRRTDVYSFGVLLFRLLTGRVPFVGEPIQVAMQHWTAAPPVPSASNPEIPAELDALILRSLAKAAADRQSSMHEVERELIAWQSAATPRARPKSAARVLDEAMWSDATQPAIVEAPSPPVAAAASVEVRSPVEVMLPVEVRPPVEDTIPKQARSEATLESVPPDVLARSEAPSVEELAASGSSTRGKVAAVVGLIGAVTLVVLFLIAREIAGPQYDTPRDAPAVTKRDVIEVPPDPVERREPQPPVVDRPIVEPTPEPTATPVVVTEPPAKREGEAGVPVRKSQKRSTPSEPRAPNEPAPVKPAAKVDPSEDVAKRARECRARFGAAGGPSITITYSIRSDGKVMHASPSEDSELGKCLAGAVKAVTFEPVQRLRVQLPL